MKLILFVIGILLLFVLTLLLMISVTGRGKITPFYAADGSILPGSIAEKIFVEINGKKNGMFIRGKSRENPVLLFISGGPGVPQYWMNEIYENKLDELYTICWWDWHGEGLSFDKSLSKENITLETLEQDACQVAEYLKKRFSVPKILLMAHSGGSMLGLRLAQRHPEEFFCYFAMGQVINKENLRYEAGYEFLKPAFEQAGNKKGLKMLNSLVKKEPGSFQIYQPDRIEARWEALLLKAGCGTTRKMRSDALGIFFPQMLCKCYTVKEKLNFWKGKFLNVGSPYHREPVGLTEKNCLIPIYFISGTFDYTCPISLVKKLYQNIEAPDKGFFEFEYSAHSPLWEENEKVIEVLKKYGEKSLSSRKPEK